jgi:hypothetical protein
MLLEFRTGYSRLANDRSQRADPEFLVIRHRDRDGSALDGLLHDDMAASPANLYEAMSFQDRANFLA